MARADLLLLAILKNVFHVYNFSIISNLFDSNISLRSTPWARIIKNVRTKCIIFGEALRIKVKKCKQNLPNIYSKSTKIAITARKSSKFFRGSMPTDLLEPFLFLNQLHISSAKKIRLEIMWKFCPSSFKVSHNATALVLKVPFEKSAPPPGLRDVPAPLNVDLGFNTQIEKNIAHFLAVITRVLGVYLYIS